MDGLNTVLEYLTSVPAWYLATSVDGQPHVRPFSFAQIQDGKLWFVTARTKDVWQELLQNQRFEATSWWPGHGWLILRGRAGLEDRGAVLQGHFLDRRRGEHLLAAHRLIPPGVHGTDIMPGSIQGFQALGGNVRRAHEQNAHQLFPFASRAAFLPSSVSS